MFNMDQYEKDKKLQKLKNSMQKYFSFSDRFLSILNSDSKKELNKLLSFQNKVNKNNFDNEMFNIDKFKNLLKISKKYLNFFSVYFNSNEFFMGGFKLNVSKDLCYYDSVKQTYTVEPGDFEIQLGGSSEDIMLKKIISVEN